MNEHYDLIIIGTGSGNTIADEKYWDKKVAIVERSTFGGTCINVGCIPTKMFVYPADIARSITEMRKLGLKGTYEGIDWQTLQKRIFETRIDPIAAAGEEYRRGERTPNVTFYKGTASFSGEKEISIEQENGDTVQITGDNIVLATGGRPFIPEILRTAGIPLHTNESIMRLPELPQSLTILGGGIVAVEFAHVFSALGTKVTLINRSQKLLRTFDQDISERFTEVSGTQWTNILGATVTAAYSSEQGKGVTVELDNGQSITSDHILVAMGRINNSDRLNVTAANIDTDSRGRIITDKFGRTSAPGIWALGDATNPYELKHVANAEARVVAHNILHPEVPETERATHWHTFNRTAIPGAVFTHPQIAVVGMTEQEARSWAEENNRKITIKIQNFGDIAYGWAMEDRTGFTKVIADAENGHILGAHLIGPQSASLIQSFVTAMTFNIDARSLAKNQYWPHPAMTEVVENALLGLEITGPEPHGLRA